MTFVASIFSICILSNFRTFSPARYIFQCIEQESLNSISCFATRIFPTWLSHIVSNSDNMLTNSSWFSWNFSEVVSRLFNYLVSGFSSMNSVSKWQFISTMKITLQSLIIMIHLTPRSDLSDLQSWRAWSVCFLRIFATALDGSVRLVIIVSLWSTRTCSFKILMRRIECTMESNVLYLVIDTSFHCHQAPSERCHQHRQSRFHWCPCRSRHSDDNRSVFTKVRQ